MGNRVQKFEDLTVWQVGVDLSIEVYNVLNNSRDFGLKNQIQRSAVSIPSNIAEGFERQTNKEFIQYLFIAKGSAGELRTQLHIADNVNEIDHQIAQKLISKATEISAMLHGLIKTRKEKF
ncbi:MAG: four helix bundle protein [Balneolaceae bacterium]|nr:four helix bundle protein [Balneolaceae bacterium]